MSSDSSVCTIRNISNFFPGRGYESETPAPPRNMPDNHRYIGASLMSCEWTAFDGKDFQ